MTAYAVDAEQIAAASAQACTTASTIRTEVDTMMAQLLALQDTWTGGAQVNFHAMADRAVTERGFWLHIAAWRTSHPVLTWRSHALRDRSRPGRLMVRPKQGILAGPISPVGREGSGAWPTPGQVLAFMDATRPQAAAEEQFGRYPGVEYTVPRDAVRLSDPRPVSR